MGGIAIRNVTKVYPGAATAAVRGVAFDVPDGAFAVIVGPSGCGKTTLLRMIAGLETITRGEIAIAGRVVNALGPAERDIAMVFQNYALYPHMSVYDNLAYGLRNRKTPRDDIDKRVREAARLLEIEPLLARRPRELSGGQRQRVAMGRAIVRHPQAFLFDEPLSNLDAKLRVQMRLEIRDLQRRLKTTSVYVTHDQLEAMTLADMLVVMNAGRVEQIGPPLELYARPASMFVAGFIGSPPMNLLPARGAGERTIALDGGGSIALGDGLQAPPGAFVVGFRPEDISPQTARGAAFALATDWVESVGADTFVYGHLAGASTASLVMRCPGSFAPPLGATTTASVAADRVHFFDPATGARIAVR